MKYFLEDIFHEESDFSSIKSNNTIPEYGLCRKCDISIWSEDPTRSLILNVCGDMIYRTYVKKIYKDGILLCLYDKVDNSDLLLPF